MRTITIDIINEKALNLLKDMELLELIRLRKEEKTPPVRIDKFRGKLNLSQEQYENFQKYLKDSRNEWDRDI